MDCVWYLEPIGRFTCTSKSILAEYRLRSFSPWLAFIFLDVAVGGDVVQDPAQVIFIISKNPYSTKPAVFEQNIPFSLNPLYDFQFLLPMDEVGYFGVICVAGKV